MNTATTHPPPAAEMRFRWRGVDADGVQKTGALIAPDVSTARAILKREKLFIVELTARGPAPRPQTRSTDVTVFTRQLASLLRAGLPLAPSLDLLAQAQHSRRQGMPRIVGTLARDITSGLRFSAALQRHPAQFNALYCQLVEVGEAAGALPAVLARIADDRERAAAQRAKVRAALTYPVAILLLAIAITAALLVWVVPTFKQIFDGFGAQLPAPTQFVLALSAGAARWSIPLVIVIFAAGSLVTFLLRRSEAARIRFARLSLTMPVAGSVAAHLVRGALEPRARHLVVGRHTARGRVRFTDSRHRQRFLRSRHAWKLPPGCGAANGSPRPCARRSCFPPEVVQPVAVAEESGALDTMLIDVASLADRQVDEKIGTLSSLCEPLVIIVLGTLVGGLVIAMYLPIIQLGNVV